MSVTISEGKEIYGEVRGEALTRIYRELDRRAGKPRGNTGLVPAEFFFSSGNFYLVLEKFKGFGKKSDRYKFKFLYEEIFPTKPEGCTREFILSSFRQQLGNELTDRILEEFEKVVKEKVFGYSVQEFFEENTYRVRYFLKGKKNAEERYVDIKLPY